MLPRRGQEFIWVSHLQSSLEAPEWEVEAGNQIDRQDPAGQDRPSYYLTLLV